MPTRNRVKTKPNGQYASKSLAEKFGDKYQVDVSGCWLWTGHRASNGYGVINHEGRQLLAHRVSLELHGRLPGESVVMHSCDVRNCVNPDHLRLGTQAQNIQDMIAKGRKSPNNANHGASNGAAKLTEEEVIAIRKSYIPHRYSTVRLAREYRVSQPLIEKIVHNKLWKHLAILGAAKDGVKL